MENIGIHIKKIRSQQNKKQQDVAAACGFTKSHLSKIENDKVVPSLGALDKIAEALNTKIGILLGEDIGEEIVQNSKEESESGMMKTSKGYSIFPFASDYGEKKMQPFLFHTNKNEHILHTTVHESEEFFFVLSGEMILKFGMKEYHLKKGDGIYFNAHIEHQTIPLTNDVEILDIIV